jgi:uncharacterized membrane protein HdeD (DUF308 family)
MGMASDTLKPVGEIGSHWRLLIFEGIALMIFGCAAITLPQLAIVGVAILLGWLFLAGGVIGLATSLIAGRIPGFWWAIASAAASIGAGVLLTIWPMHGLYTLTFILAGFLFADGFMMIMYGMDHRNSRHWRWLVANGAIDLLLAPVVLVALWQSAVWLLPLVIGIDMLFGGASLIAVATAARPK